MKIKLNIHLITCIYLCMSCLVIENALCQNNSVSLLTRKQIKSFEKDINLVIDIQYDSLYVKEKSNFLIKYFGADTLNLPLKTFVVEPFQSDNDLYPISWILDKLRRTNLKNFTIKFKETKIVPIKNIDTINKSRNYFIWKGLFIKQFEGSQSKKINKSDEVHFNFFIDKSTKQKHNLKIYKIILASNKKPNVDSTVKRDYSFLKKPISFRLDSFMHYLKNNKNTHKNIVINDSTSHFLNQIFIPDYGFIHLNLSQNSDTILSLTEFLTFNSSHDFNFLVKSTDISHISSVEKAEDGWIGSTEIFFNVTNFLDGIPVSEKPPKNFPQKLTNWRREGYYIYKLYIEASQLKN